jgi:hypothetical protein
VEAVQVVADLDLLEQARVELQVLRRPVEQVRDDVVEVQVFLHRGVCDGLAHGGSSKHGCGAPSGRSGLGTIGERAGILPNR